MATAVEIDGLPPYGPQRTTGVGVALRILGSVVLAYLTLVGGAYAQGLPVALLSTVAMLTPFAVIILRAADRERWATWSALAMIVSGALLTPYVHGGYYFVGVVVLLTWGLLPTRVGIVVSSVSGLLMLALVARQTYTAEGWSPTLGYAAGVLAAILFGLNRRQSRERQLQERALVERSRELQQRSRELIAQTELTRTETARAAALEERTRLARDLHDLLAHSLGGLIRQLDAAEALLAERHDVVGATERLRSSRDLAIEGLREARLAVSELRAGEPRTAGPSTAGSSAAGSSAGASPTVGASAGQDLVAAVRRIAYGPVGLQLGVELDVLGSPVLVPAPVVDAFVAVTREALTNAAKHASATRVSMALVFDDTAIRLEIGNPVNQPADGELADSGSGLGLTGLAERMTAIDGSLTAGQIGARWLLTAELPLRRVE